MRVAEEANIITMAKVIKEDDDEIENVEDEVDENVKSQEEEDAAQITLKTE